MFATYAWFLPTQLNIALDVVAVVAVGTVLWLRHRHVIRAERVEPATVELATPGEPATPAEPTRELVDA
jgi:hypothetical protein